MEAHDRHGRKTFQTVADQYDALDQQHVIYLLHEDYSVTVMKMVKETDGGDAQRNEVQRKNESDNGKNGEKTTSTVKYEKKTKQKMKRGERLLMKMVQGKAIFSSQAKRAMRLLALITFKHKGNR
jgi:hypothetical protein